MATGDDAVGAGMDLVSGAVLASTIDTEINKTRDYIAQRTSAITPVAKGGTGSSTASGARSTLDVLKASDAVRSGNGTNNVLRLDYTDGRYRMRVDGTDVGAIATVGDVTAVNDSLANALAGKVNNGALDGAINDKVSKGGDTITGNLFLPNSSAATSSFQVCYINGDGRVSRGSSSQRYKKYISPFDPTLLGYIFPPFVRYKMRGDGESPAETIWRYGYIAEELAQHPDQERFVVYRDVDGSGEQVPDSIDFIGLLLAQTAQLQAELVQAREDADLAHDALRGLEQRIARLEGQPE